MGKSSFETRLNKLVAGIVTAEDKAIKAESEMVELMKKEKPEIADTFIIKHNFDRVEQLEESKHKYYGEILNILENKGVKWAEITFYLQTEVYGDSYPLKSNGKPVGIGKARKDGIESAIMINRFNVYRNRFSDYGVEKPRVEKYPVLKGEKTDAEKATDKAIKDSEKRIEATEKAEKEERSCARVFTLTDLQNVSSDLLLTALYRNKLVADNMEAATLIEQLSEVLKIKLLA